MVLISVFKDVTDWLVGFFSLQSVFDIISSGHYGQLLSKDGIISVVAPLFPIFLVIEIVRALLLRRFKALDYKIPFFTYVLNAFIGRFISIGMVVFCIAVFQRFALFKADLTWYWFIYGYIVWELGHFIYHYLAHKVRLFWCLHSTHHAPQAMNLSLSYAHFFLEAPYADFIRTTTCLLLGVPPPLLFLIMFIDGTWGGFIHIGEHLMKNARLGFLYPLILTPSHHRVHHARNPMYMDTNFCNLLNVWDRVFKTYQAESKSVQIEYGITRKMKENSFLDAYFGEIGALARDVYKAPGIKNKLLYIFMPPGWHHTGEHKTARTMRRAALKGFAIEGY